MSKRGEEMNVVLLILDALRYDHVNEETTPNLMRIAAKGVSFTDSHACNTSTLHSMPCILGSDTEYDPESNIATVLKRHGVTTAMIHSNPMVHNFYPGFDETLDLKSKKFRMSKSWRKTIRRNLPPGILASMKKLRANMYSEERYLPYSRADEVLDFTLKWMGDHDGYFLWSHIMEPHIPYYPIETSLDMSRKEMRELNDKFIEAVHGNYTPTAEEIDKAKTLYREDVHEMDREIGLFFDNVNKDDLLVITADHGEEFGEEGQFSHHSNKFIPILTHVPLIFCGGGAKERAVIDEKVTNLSITPTILDALGIDERIGKGASIWPLLKK
ncbi:sulfatase [Candidatus Bathyarchaeota archaeon]|nr:sulfatase [Candidatus Bathyarchaeota archaeon]